jgi:ketosteroid isomerase-like protein
MDKNKNIDMKHFITITLFLFSGVIVSAQGNNEKLVADAVEQLRKAMVDGDSVRLTHLTSPLLSYGHSSGVVQDQKEFVSKIVSGASDFVTIDLTDQTIKISGDAAIVRHTLSASTNDGGKPGTVKLHVLTVWQKDHGKWKLLARQAVKVP